MIYTQDGKILVSEDGHLCESCCTTTTTTTYTTETSTTTYEEGEECTHCSGKTPKYLEVTISGMTTDFTGYPCPSEEEPCPCNDCFTVKESSWNYSGFSSLDGTYILTQNTEDNLCAWRYTASSSFGQIDYYSIGNCEGEPSSTTIYDEMAIVAYYNSSDNTHWFNVYLKSRDIFRCYWTGDLLGCFCSIAGGPNGHTSCYGQGVGGGSFTSKPG